MSQIRVADVMTEDNWAKGCTAFKANPDKKGEMMPCSSLDSDACKRCLLGWVFRLYPAGDGDPTAPPRWVQKADDGKTVVPASASSRLNAALVELFPDWKPTYSAFLIYPKKFKSYVDFNDDPKTTFAMVRQLVVAAGV